MSNGYRRGASARRRTVESAARDIGVSDSGWRELVSKEGSDQRRPPPFLSELPPVGAPYAPKSPIGKRLQALIEDNLYVQAFETAITAVSRRRIPELERIKTLNQFYYYVDALVSWVPEIRVWNFDGQNAHERTVYLRITQFYYYFNQPSLGPLQSPIDPAASDKDLTPLSRWLREFAVQWGEFLDTSASSELLSSFKYAPEYSWQDYERAPEEYATFNAFFARQFRDIDKQRPVAQPKNDRVVVFPAESTFVGQWAVSTPVGPPLPAPPTIVVKHVQWPIPELLEHSKHASCFEGGLLCHSFLNTYDYHRLHTPVRGKVLEAKFIPGQVYLDVELQRQAPDDPADGDVANAVIPRRYLDADDPTGYQFVQCRGLLVLDSPVGKVAVLPMGMAQVSSVVFVKPKKQGHQPIQLTSDEDSGLSYAQKVEKLNAKLELELVSAELAKGEMFSFFQFGGSDCVVVFERNANINITATVGRHYPIRSQYALSNYD